MRRVIVCPQSAAAEAGAQVLREGGSAVDAAVTAAFVQGVVDPHMCGIGGGGVMNVRLAAGRRTEVIEFYPRAGGRTRPDQWADLFERESEDGYGYVLRGRVNDVGYQSVAVPGTVRGLATALERHGTIPWRRALEPAVEIARAGVAVSPSMRDHWVKDLGPDYVQGLERLKVTPASERIYLPDGRLPAIGQVLDFSDLARTLERLAGAGADDFYRGEIAAAIADDFQANGGHITAEDLAGFEARVLEPLRGRYRHLDLHVPPAPGGGPTLLKMLQVLEASSPPSPADLVRAMEAAVADRALQETATTTHLCVLDGQGNAVSLTHTNAAWSGVVTPGLGFNYNDYMNCFDPRPGQPASIAPGRTRVSMMCPTMGFDGDRLAMVIGAPGATRIVTGILHTIVNIVDHGMSPVEAVSAPRYDFQQGIVSMEGRVTREVESELSGLGHRMVRRPYNYDSYFARTQVIWMAEADTAPVGASDPRGDGGAVV